MITVADNSFLLFIYPFLFDAATFGERVKAIESSTAVVKKRAKAPTNEPQNESVPFWVKVPTFPRDEMLAYIADYLNPREPGAEATAQMWTINKDLENVYGLFGRADWQLHAKQSSKGPWSFEFGAKGGENWAVHLMLFRDGVGFLSLRIRPVSPDLDDWLSLTHFFRFAEGQRRVSVSSRIGVGFDERRNERLYEPFFPEPAGGTEALTGDRAVFDKVLDSLLLTAADKSDREQWWRDVFVPEQLIPFAALFVKGLEPVNDLRVAYKLRHFFRPSQGNDPAAADMAPDHPSLFAYAERQWFTFSLAGGAFLACDPPETDFLRTTLPHHLRDLYFLVLLFALHQRFKLMDLSEQVAKRWLTTSGSKKLSTDELAPEQIARNRYEAFEEIRTQFLEFTARGYFAQIMQHEHHHRFYRKWQEVFQIRDLYEEVRDEVREMYQFLQSQLADQIREATNSQRNELERQTREQERRARSLSVRISILASLVVVPSIVFGFLGMNIRYFTAGNDSGLTKLQAVLWSTGGLALLALIAYLVLELIRKRLDRESERRTQSEEARVETAKLNDQRER